jgi:hypothetical protein
MTIVIQDVYLVVGREELPFEAALRELYKESSAPPVGDLVLAAWLPHGGGQAYEAVTLRAVADASELQQLIDWNRSDAGRGWSTRIEAMCNHQHSSLHELAGGDLLAARDWSSDPSGQRPPLFRLDVLTLESVGAAHDFVLPQAAAGSDSEDPIEPIAWWWPIGDLGASVVSVLYGFTPGGLARSAELVLIDELWPGEVSLPANARTTRMLRGARSIVATADSV